MDSSFFTIMAALGMFMVLFVIITIITYILMSIGIQSLVKKMKIQNSWVCWLPIVNIYALGLLIVDKSKVPKIDLVMLYGNIIAVLIFLFGGNSTILLALFIILSLAMYILFLYSVYLLYERYSPENKVFYTVLSIAFVLLTPIFIFSIRNNDPENITIESSELIADGAVEFINTTTTEAVETTPSDETTL